MTTAFTLPPDDLLAAFDSLEATLKTDTSGDRARRLNRYFAQVELEARQSQVRSIDCRSQSCRVEIGSAAGPALGQVLPMVIAQLGGSLPRVTAGQVDQGDGSQATVLYLSR